MRTFLCYIAIILLLLLSSPTYLFSQELGDWIQVEPLPAPRSGCAATVVDTTIYVMGGYSGTTIPLPVLRTTIQPSGYLTPWIQESTQMNHGRDGGILVNMHGYLFAFGGDAGPGMGFSTTVERAQIQPDMSLGEWTTIGYTPRGFWRSAWVQTSAFVYILGAWEGTTEVWRIWFNPDGSMGTWEIITSHQFNVKRGGFAFIQGDKGAYSIGGATGSGEVTTVEFAPFLQTTDVRKEQWERFDSSRNKAEG